MSVEPAAQAIPWEAIRLVVFDMDGTLYDQRALRLRMARDLLIDALVSRRVTPLRILSHYRRGRERLAEAEIEDFETVLRADVAARLGVAPAMVDAAVDEWIDRRPLRYIGAARFAGVTELFAAIHRQGKALGLLSDYPGRAKLAALGLEVDHCLAAGDPAVRRMKPHPTGLVALINAAGVTPQQTVLIGDRIERDGAAAQRAGAHALIRSSRPRPGWHTFARYDDPVFASLFAAG